MVRTILHLDLDAFYCAVEENQNPELINKIIAAEPTRNMDLQA